MSTPIAHPSFLPSTSAAAPVRTSSAAPAPSRAPAPHPFAQMLKQNQAAQPNAAAGKAPSSAEKPDHRDETGDADTSSAVDTEATEAAGTQGRADAPGRARRAHADERSTPRAARALIKEADTALPLGEAKATDKEDAAASPTPIDPAPAIWPAERPPLPNALPRDLTDPAAHAGAERRELTAAPAAADKARADGDAAPIDGPTPSRTARAEPSAPEFQRIEPDAKGESKAFSDLVAQRLAIELPAPALAAERGAAIHPAEALSTRLEAFTATPLFSAAAFTPAAAATPIAAPVDVRLATPVASPDFAPALGAQISVLASNGVQRAELHLNPAEMGPVSVQIVVDGGQARVEFGADFAATRQAIENGLPELASALRDAGLTLTGGGVSQHARGRGDRGAESGSNPGRNARTGAEPEPVASVRPRSVALGGVDLYA